MGEEVGCEGGQCTQYCAPGDPCTANGENVPCTCASGKTYHGRGPMQPSWNYNYAPAGVALRPFVNDPNLDLLADPDRITADPKLAFATAIYFWMTPRENKPSCHDVMVDKWTPSAVDLVGNRRAGYGVTTNIINTSSRICEDAAVAPGMAEAAESVSRMDRKGRTCADYGKRLCKKRKWCRFDPDGQTCEEKEAGYLR